MRLQTIDAGRSWSVQLHNAVFDDKILLFASVGGLESQVRGALTSLMEGRSLTITNDQGRTINLFAENGEYKKIEGKIGDLSHGILIHKSCVFEENYPSPVIIAPNGDINGAIANYLIARYALPAEWKQTYHELVSGSLDRLWVWKNPLNYKWGKMAAVRINAINEESIIKGVDERLKNGTYKVPTSLVQGKFDQNWNMKEYLSNNIQVLAEQMDKTKPIHDGQSLPEWIADLKRVPFPTQAHAMAGLVKAFDHYKDLILAGDMGTGKSIIALGVIYGLSRSKDSFPVLVMAPSLTINKWIESEIKATLPGDVSVRVISSTEDALRYRKDIKNGYRPNGIEFVIVGTDRAKLGSYPWCSALYKRINGTKTDYAWHCPDCNEILLDPEAKKGEEAIAFWPVLAEGTQPHFSEMRTEAKNTNGIPLTTDFKWKQKSRLKKCPHCGAKLWRPALKSRGEDKNKPRESIARIFKSLGQYFELFLCDEVHQTRAEDSGRGDAFAQCVQSAKRVLSLTGTVTTGKSTSIKEILWRTSPAELLAKGFDYNSGKLSWAKNYGVLTRTTKEYPEDTGIVTRRKKVAKQPIEQPGISPKMITDFLWHRCLTLELGDLGLPLVELKEIPVFLDMDPAHANNYKVFHKQIQEYIKRHLNLFSLAGVAKMNPATINYADRPDLGGEVTFIPRNPNERPTTITAPAFPPDYYTPKEKHLVETVQKELAEGRGVMIYANFTDSYGIDQRLQKVLADHGIDSEILKSSVSQDRRTEWLADAEARGVKVVITNMRLVEVGIDAIFLPTIYFYQLNEDINVVRQASRRAWRIGQDKECRVYYAVYNGTTQVAQFKRLMTKRSHALMAEGRLDKSELKNYGSDGRNKLTLDIAECLAETDLAQKWVELSKKDMDKNLKVVSEQDFKQAQRTIMGELAKETLRLCGLQEDEIKAKLGEENSVTTSEFTPIPISNLPSYLQGVSHGTGLQYRFQEVIKFTTNGAGQYKARGFVNVPNNYSGHTVLGKGNSPDEAFLDYLNNCVSSLERWANGEYSSQKAKIQKLLKELNELKLLVQHIKPQPQPDVQAADIFEDLGFEPLDMSEFTDFIKEPVEPQVLVKYKPIPPKKTKKKAVGGEQLTLF